MNLARRLAAVFVCVSMMSVLVGCATSAPKVKFADSGTHVLLRSGDTAAVTVTAAPGIVLADYEKSRIADAVKTRLSAGQQHNAGQGDPSQYDIEITVTRYEKGNAFARAMLAGLGQMHIDARVLVKRAGSSEAISDFVVQKTFAWGGVYGASTHMEDVEQGFSEGVVQALTGQGEGGAKPDDGTRAAR